MYNELWEYNLSHAVHRMKILSYIVYTGSLPVESKCMSPRCFHKEEQNEDKKNWINVL